MKLQNYTIQIMKLLRMLKLHRHKKEAEAKAVAAKAVSPFEWAPGVQEKVRKGNC
ncbi:hypothetical protein RCO48_02380 [Peribacillus frigoritolerans]|nr:hypothetical protein [Peribacillus frigoritolerans]